MIRLALAFALVATAADARTVRIQYNPGGAFDDFAARVQHDAGTAGRDSEKCHTKSLVKDLTFYQLWPNLAGQQGNQRAR